MRERVWVEPGAPPPGTEYCGSGLLRHGSTLSHSGKTGAIAGLVSTVTRYSSSALRLVGWWFITIQLARQRLRAVNL